MGNSQPRGFVPHPLNDLILPNYSAVFHSANSGRSMPKGMEGCIDVVDPEGVYKTYLVPSVERIRAVVNSSSTRNYVCVNVQNADGFFLVQKSVLINLQLVKGNSL